MKPQFIVGIVTTVIAAASGTALRGPGALDDSDRTIAPEGLSTRVERLAVSHDLSGALAIATPDWSVRKAWGLANRDFNARNMPETKFNLGSINKIFTRVVVTQLVQEGKLRWTDTIRSQLPDYGGPGAAVITIDHLVQHRSGLGDIFGDEFLRSSPRAFVNPRDYFKLFTSKALLFQPGSRQEYSNAGYIVLGAIVEVACGVDYFECVQQRVFDPFGMNDTGFYESDRPVVNRAVGYTTRGGPLRSNVFTSVYKGTPAGGGYSTVDDLARFADALRTGKLPLRDLDLRQHPLAVAGGARGVSALLAIDRSWTVAILSNGDPPVAETVYEKLLPMLTEKDD
jgi:D-alanyl-D-alanine carboxypeptidase